MKKVLVGTPCYDGRIDVWYVHALMNTIKESYTYDVEIIPMWVSFDALLQRARNDTLHIALSQEYDELFWIDSDIEWTPSDFFKILNYPVDVVGATYPKKSSIEEYVFNNLKKKDPTTGLIEVDGLGTGFVKMSRAAMQYLWDVSDPYVDPKDFIERRMVFDVVIENNGLVSEDIHAFKKLTKGGFKIWLDPDIICNHSGPKKYTGNFANWYNKTHVRNNRQL